MYLTINKINTICRNGNKLFALTTPMGSFYGMEYHKGGTKENGKKYNHFITEPSRKAVNGNYYKNYFVNIDAETRDTIADYVADNNSTYPKCWEVEEITKTDTEGNEYRTFSIKK